MPTDLIRYDLLVQGALKSVVHKVLSDVARDGLPGDHHFYLSFRTNHVGVKLSPRLRERYPQDMTIVLQHQFDDLTVGENAFEVGLSFSGISERLRVPYDALSGFFDPSVQFGLKFEAGENQDGEEPIGPAALPTRSALPALARGPHDEPAEEAEPPKKGRSRKALAKAPAQDEAGAEQGGAQVVSLDAFRKKS